MDQAHRCAKMIELCNEVIEFLEQEGKKSSLT
jgi:hypothetical protein